MRKLNLLAICVFSIVFLLGFYAAQRALNYGFEQDQPPTFVASLLSPGVMQTGHEKLTCSDCHHRAKGTIRQQLQTISYNVLHNTNHPVDFGFKPVNSTTCLNCHERPNERHPIHRFKELRFIEAVAKIDGRSCLTCHGEHTAHRLRRSKITFCSACHGDLKLKNDPLDISHETIIKNKDWASCMGCHDFHGNHKYVSPVKYDQRINRKKITAYMRDGKDPYGKIKQFLAETQKE